MRRWGDTWSSHQVLEYHLLFSVVEVYAVVPTRQHGGHKEGETSGQQWHRYPTTTENWL